MIELRNVNKVYNKGGKNQITAINHTSLTLGEKGMVAILGASGCGKTTLLNVIGGLDKPNRGQIFVNGQRMNSVFSGKTDNIRNANIGYIFQNYHLMDQMTVFENVALVLRMVGIRNKEEVRQSVHYVLERVGLYQYRNRPVDTLSGGERQRVGIARALLKNPGIIIADEPTGNLDSRNSLEVMNIIKAISRDKLVILVTHEKKLAHFFADRIIDVVDGKVVDDRDNSHNDALDYHVDNKIYLQDLPIREDLTAERLKLSYISDGSVPVEVRLVIKGGNLFIQCDGHKVDVVDSGSAVELVDDHYRALTQEEAEKYSFDYEKISHKKKLRYRAINNPFNSLWNGFKTVFGFSAIKKVLLLGFVAAAGFMMFAFSSYIGIRTVTDDEFITVNKNYVSVNTQRNDVASLQELASVEGVAYVLPGDSNIGLTMDFSKKYYQTNQQITIYGSLASSELLQAEDIVEGRLPENDREIVVDRMILQRLLKEGSVVMLGLPGESDFVGQEVYLMKRTAAKYTIVGVSDLVSPSIYTAPSAFEEILVYGASDNGMGKDPESGALVDDVDNNAEIADVADAKGELTIKSGRLPEEDYEVILHENMRDWEHRIGATIKSKVNGVNLTIVGYYKSTDDTESRQFTNAKTFYYQWLSTTSGAVLCCGDRQAVTEHLQEQRMNVRNNYDDDRAAYMESVKDTVRTTVIVAAVIAAIALIEMYLILRSSFLSRIKEVGTLRAIGVKKGDIYRQFLGEVLAITLLTATPGFVIVGYVMKSLCQYSFFANQYAFNTQVVLGSVLTVLVFQIVAGLLPVFLTLRKTPAAILARTDVD